MRLAVPGGAPGSRARSWRAAPTFSLHFLGSSPVHALSLQVPTVAWAFLLISQGLYLQGQSAARRGPRRPLLLGLGFLVCRVGVLTAHTLKGRCAA